MLLSLWLVPAARRFIKAWWLIIATAAALSCLAVSGSRGAMIASGIVCLAAVGSASALKGGLGTASRTLLLPTVIVLAAAALYPIAFPDGYEAFLHRWSAAADVETQSFSLGVFGRALYGFVDFFQYMASAPLTGYGLGFAGNARTILAVTVPGLTDSGETDWARHMIDLGPIIGVAFIFYRLMLTTWLGVTCFKGTRNTGNPLALLLFADIGVELLYGEITGNGTINGYAWLLAGVCIAASKSPLAATATATASDAAIAVEPRFANLMR
jgi:hypothetical protein